MGTRSCGRRLVFNQTLTPPHRDSRVCGMVALEAALWGALGGFVVEGLQFANAIKRVGGWPWRWSSEPGPFPFLVSVLIRLAAGAGLAAAAGASGQVSTEFACFALGVAAPLVVEKIVQAATPTRLPNLRQEQVATPTTGAGSSQPVDAEAGDGS